MKKIVLIALLLIGLSATAQVYADFFRVFPIKTGTNQPAPAPTPVPSGMSFPVQSYGGECNTQAPRPYPPTTANTIAGNSTVAIANIVGFKQGGGIRIKHVAAFGITGTPATPTVTAVQLVTGETHTVAPGTGVATFTSSSNFTANYSLRINQSQTSLTRIGSGTPTISQYSITPPVGVGHATYNVQTANMTTPISVLNNLYWTPDVSDATQYCYKNRFIDAADGVSVSSSAGCTTTGASTLGPTRAVVDNYGAALSTATSVCIYRSTDGANYPLYYAQPLSDVSVTGAPAAVSNEFVDEGSAIGPFFVPPIVDNNCPPSPDAVNYAQDLIAKVAVLVTPLPTATPTQTPIGYPTPSPTPTGVGPTPVPVPGSMVLSAPPTQSSTGAMAWTDDTQAVHDAWLACANAGGGFVDVPNACRIDYLNGNNYPDLFTGQTNNGCTLRGTKNYVTGNAAHLYIDGTGNGACSMQSNQNGAISMYFQTGISNLLLGCNDNGSTNYELSCLLNWGNSFANGSGVLIHSGNGGNGGPFNPSNQTNAPNCPNATGMVIVGSAFDIEQPLFVRNRRVAYSAANATHVTGPGDSGFTFWPKFPMWENIAGMPFSMEKMVMERGPNWLRVQGASSGGVGTIKDNYFADTPDGTICGVTLDCGDNVPLEIGSVNTQQGDPNLTISNNLIQGGTTGAVIMSQGTTVEFNNFYGQIGSKNGVLLQDGWFGNFSNNYVAYNNFQGAGYSSADITDDATLGVNNIGSNFYQSVNGPSIDLTNATDSGEIFYDRSVDPGAAGCANCYQTVNGQPTGILDPNHAIPKLHHVHYFANNTNSADDLMDVSIGGSRNDKPVTCAEAAGAGCVLNLSSGNSQIITIADSTNFFVSCSGAPLKIGKQWNLDITALAGVTPGTATFTNCFAPINNPATGHPAAGTTVHCAGTILGSNQSDLSCSGDISAVATPTPTPTPIATPTPTATPTPMATPTPQGGNSPNFN